MSEEQLERQGRHLAESERDAVVANLAVRTRERDAAVVRAQQWHDEWHNAQTRGVRAEKERDGLREALEQIAKQQLKTLAMIEHNGFVFDSIGKEPGNWQHLAFTIYSDLCMVDSIAREALEKEKETS